MDYLKFNTFNIKDSDTLIKILKNDTYNLLNINKDSIYYKNYLLIKKYLSNEENIENFYIHLFQNVYFSEIIFDNDVNENLIFSN